MTAAAVGTLTTTSSSGQTAQSFTSVNDGAVIVLATLIISPTIQVSSVAGHGATWLPGRRLATAGSGVTIEEWYGKIRTVGTSNITVTWSSSNAGIFTAFDSLEFNAGLGRDTVWNLESSGGQDNAAATTVAYPTLVPTGGGQVYVGHAYGDAVALNQAGADGTFTWITDSADNQYIYNTDVSASVSPVSGVTSSQTSHSIGILLSAGLPARRNQPPTARRRASNW